MELVTEKKTKMKRWKKGLWVTFGSLIFFIILAIIFVTVYINRSLPLTSGKLAVEGLIEEVKIVRDVNGVPHIKAKNAHDLYFSQGYVQAQDRFFKWI